MIFPLLLWTITFTFTAFEGFRQSASNLKAAYTVSDLISRESAAVTDVYIDSLHELMAKWSTTGLKSAFASRWSVLTKATTAIM